MRLGSARRRLPALAIVAVTMTGVVVAGPQVVEAQVVVRVRAGEVSGPVSGSAVFTLPFAARHLAVHWAGKPEAQVTVATSTGGARFGPPAEAGRDEVGEQRNDGETYGAVLPAGGATVVRVTSDRPLARATVLALADGERVVTYKPVPAQPARADVNQPEIRSRADWGADESLRFKGRREVWPPEFHPFQKLIVHHTAGTNDDDEPEATIRAIYYYHAVTQRWGDIGYNFLISAGGHIFKGRHSHLPSSQDDTITGEDGAGNTVTGGHAYQHNAGTVGVALLGTFTETGPAQRARDRLVEFLAWKLNAHGNLDPQGGSEYTNPVNGVVKWLYNIAGHRDTNATECPGGVLYDSLSDIRSEVKHYMDDRIDDTTTTSSPTTNATTTTTKRSTGPQ